MAKSHWRTEIYDSTQFLESAGTILFDFRSTNLYPPRQNDSECKIPCVCVFYSSERNEYLLPKGRRNVSESRAQAALRETYEETGLRCHLLPVTLHSRATSINPANDKVSVDGFTLDEVRSFQDVSDPFTVAIRYVPAGPKLIWWFIGAVDEVQDETQIDIDPGCEVVSVPVTDVVQLCTFEDDRQVVKKAITIVEETFGVSWTSQEFAAS